MTSQIFQGTLAVANIVKNFEIRQNDPRSACRHGFCEQFSGSPFQWRMLFENKDVHCVRLVYIEMVKTQRKGTKRYDDQPTLGHRTKT